MRALVCRGSRLFFHVWGSSFLEKFARLAGLREKDIRKEPERAPK